VRLWRRRPSRGERDLDDRGEAVARDLLEQGMRDLDRRSGLLGRLERRLLPRRERDRSD
jgi:hypothetical protein